MLCTLMCICKLLTLLEVRLLQTSNARTLATKNYPTLFFTSRDKALATKLQFMTAGVILSKIDLL